jgi:uncharacterized membrane protein HdeD (DUF308 family)
MSTAVDGRSDQANLLAGAAKFWWLYLITGIAWLLVSLIILQTDTDSVVTVGLIIGFMFLFAGIQNFFLAAVTPGGWKVLWIIFGVVLLLAGLWAIFHPGKTFLELADSLGFLFMLVGIVWVVEAFMTKAENELWWLGLLSGILMLVIAFWVSGQFLIEKAYTLLIFAGVWALMTGVIDIVRAFQVRKLGSSAAS